MTQDDIDRISMAMLTTGLDIVDWEEAAVTELTAAVIRATGIDRIRAICEDGERSGADRLDEIYRIVTGDPHHA